MENIVTADLTEPIANVSILKSKLISGEYKFSQKRKKSKVWNTFGYIEDSNGQEIRSIVGCKKCLNIYKFEKSTSNLVRHKCYKVANVKVPKVESMELDAETKKRCTAISYKVANVKVPKVESMELDAETKKKCTAIITEWTVLDCRPFNISNDAGLQKLASFFISVGATYGSKVKVENLLPHPTTISQNIEKLYKHHFDQIKTEISKVRANSYGITSDVWTDNYIRSSFLSVTIHYIWEGKLINRLLAMKSMKGDACTGTNIRNKFLKVLNDFDCLPDEENPIIVTDRGSNMLSAFRNSDNIQCINHLINNIVEKTVNSVPELTALISQCSKLVKYFKKSGINSDIETTLKSMCPTRWNTAFYLLRSIQTNWFEILNILKEKNELHRVQLINLNDLTSITELLESFENSSKILEADNYPTLHLVIPHIHRLKKACLANEDDTDILKHTKAALLEFLQNVVTKNLKIFHKLAVFLFPPTNKMTQFTETEKNEIITMCKTVINSILKSCSNNNQDSSLHQNQNNSIFADFIESQGTSTPDSIIVNEINTYKSLTIPFTDHFDVIKWWNDHEDQFPHLYKVSCKILSTPATSVSSERAFSAARLLITEKRCNILKNLDLVDKIMFLHSNINEITEYMPE